MYASIIGRAALQVNEMSTDCAVVRVALTPAARER
jgi:hypothetical protein